MSCYIFLSLHAKALSYESGEIIDCRWDTSLVAESEPFNQSRDSTPRD